MRELLATKNIYVVCQALEQSAKRDLLDLPFWQMSVKTRTMVFNEIHGRFITCGADGLKPGLAREQCEFARGEGLPVPAGNRMVHEDVPAEHGELAPLPHTDGLSPT